MRARDLLADHWPELVAMCFGAGWFFYLGYGPTLDPRSIGWMMREDWSFFFWGWSFFRRADWAFPLGSLPNLSYPLGTSVAFCDANPWLSLLFKPLSRFLPLDFQFFGIWFLACYMLQALVGAKITETMTSDRLQRALGGALFATSPVLPIRAYHVSLSAIFFVTAGVWLNLVRSDDAQKARRYAIYSFVLLAWVTGTHGYLAARALRRLLRAHCDRPEVDLAPGRLRVPWRRAALGARHELPVRPHRLAKGCADDGRIWRIFSGYAGLDQLSRALALRARAAF
jgi:hypothetical protein